MSTIESPNHRHGLHQIGLFYVIPLGLLLTLLLARLWIEDQFLLLQCAIALFIALVVSLCAAVRWNIVHPCLWYSATFALYALGAPVLFLFGELGVGGMLSVDSMCNTMWLQFVALITFAMMVGPTRHVPELTPSRIFLLASKGANVLILLMGAISVFHLASWFNLGLTSKLDKYFSKEFVPLDFVFVILLFMMSLRAASGVILQGRKRYVEMGCYAVFLVMAYLITGSRELVLRFVTVYILLYGGLLGLWRMRQVVPLAALAAYGSTLMADYKNFLLSFETIEREALFNGLQQLVTTLFSSEFRSASENLAILVEHMPDSIPFFDGQLTAWELALAFRIGFLSTNANYESAATWFTETFFPVFAAQGGGSGFTLVGQGYGDFGISGVIILFFALGVLFRRLYRWSSRGPLQFVIYANIVPLMIYATRQGVAPLLSQSLKHILIPLVIAIVIGTVIGLRKSAPKPALPVQVVPHRRSRSTLRSKSMHTSGQ